MRRMLLACAALIAGCGSAAAQDVIETPPPNVYVVTPAPYDYPVRSYRSTTRVYETTRYYRDIDDDDDVVIVRRRHRGGCGPHYHWNGDRCIYVRD
jgi:hypothetical protein